MDKLSLEASKQTYRKEKALSGKEKEDADTLQMNKSKAGLISSGIGTNDNQIFAHETRQEYHHGHHFFVAVNY